MTPRIVSCNVSRPVPVNANGQVVLTGIFKVPVEGRRQVSRLNIEGDQQADLRVHGGLLKAVYAYPSEHYPWWREQLPDIQMSWGMFGENLTTEGWDESALHVGDQLRAGSALFQVTQPRMPCFKLALKFNRPDMVKRFWASGRSGFYLSVLEEGAIEPGDTIERVSTGEPAVTLAEVVSLYRDPYPDREALERALRTSLAPGWKEELRERLALSPE